MGVMDHGLNGLVQSLVVMEHKVEPANVTVLPQRMVVHLVLM